MKEHMSLELRENLSAFCENRKRVYTLLARSYEREIDEGFASAVAGSLSVDSDNEVLTREVEAIRSALESHDEQALEHLAVVFNRVFYGMGPRTAEKAFPYESVYTSTKGLMMQAAYEEVKNLYRTEGFVKDPAFTEPEDHIALELSFMSLLCDKALEALAEDDEDTTTKYLTAGRTFLQEHLLNWVPLLVLDIKASAQEGFYWHLAVFTEAFLQADEQALAEVLD